MIELLIALLIISVITILLLLYRISKIKEQNLITFRDKLKTNSVCLLQEWDDTLDKQKMIQVTIIHKGTYTLKVIDENMQYHIVNPEDLFPLNYHICRDN